MGSVKPLLRYDGSCESGLNHSVSPLLSRKMASPTYLWIDCVDNGFAGHDIAGLPSEMVLVYRNLAHQINYTDLNCLSVLQYAVQVAGIKHVIVCGHSDCAMLRLSIQHTPADLVENWLSPVKAIYRKYESQLSLCQTESLRLEKLCELNVIEQVFKLCQTPVVQHAWKQGHELTLHGWAYSSHGRLLKDLAIDVAGGQDAFPVYRTAIWNCLQRPTD